MGFADLDQHLGKPVRDRRGPRHCDRGRRRTQPLDGSRSLDRIDERLALGAELGSDVPFALYGGTALGLGRGERLRRLRLAAPFRAVVAVPRWRVETARAFRALDRRKYGLTRWPLNLRFSEALGRDAVTPNHALRLGNAFEKVLGGQRSGFLSLCARLRHAGAEEPHLTGSGSAVFGILPATFQASRFVHRFVGDETIYLVRSRGRGLTHHVLP